MNDNEEKKVVKQKEEVEVKVCTKPFDAESSRMSDEDLPCKENESKV